MKKAILILSLVLSACATQQTQNSGNSARESARVHTELGAGYFAQNQLAIALEEFNDAVKSDASYSLAYNGLGLVYSALREDDKADSNFKKAIELDPGNSESRNNYGTFLCTRERIDESITQFMEAVKNPLYISPEIAYLNAGLCSLRKKDSKNAETYFRKALQIKPLLHQAAYQTALLEFNRGQVAEARVTMQNALSTNDATAEMLWLGIRIERKLGDRDAEASYALLLRKKYPNSEQTKALLAGQ